VHFAKRHLLQALFDPIPVRLKQLGAFLPPLEIGGQSPFSPCPSGIPGHEPDVRHSRENRIVAQTSWRIGNLQEATFVSHGWNNGRHGSASGLLRNATRGHDEQDSTI